MFIIGDMIRCSAEVGGGCTAISDVKRRSSAVVKRAMKSGFIGLFLLRVVHRIPRDTPIHATLNSSLFLIGMVLANHWLMKSH